MARRFRRNSVARQKALRVSEVNTGRINKRKYYGVKTEQKEMKESLEYHFTHTSVIDNLTDSLAGVEQVEDSNAEALADDVVGGTSFLRDGEDEVLEDVEEPLSESFDKGTRRAFNSEGETLDAPEDVEGRVSQIVDEQRNYISQLDQDLREKARQIIREGVAAGLSTSAIVDNLRGELKDLIDNRSSTISETETVAAAGAGVAATFDHNGVTRVEWVAEIDEKTCESGAFRVTHNGTTYTSCRELDNAEFERQGVHPNPVEDTHPNCRCLLVAVED